MRKPNIDALMEKAERGPRRKLPENIRTEKVRALNSAMRTGTSRVLGASVPEIGAERQNRFLITEGRLDREYIEQINSLRRKNPDIKIILYNKEGVVVGEIVSIHRLNPSHFSSNSEVIYYQDINAAYISIE